MTKENREWMRCALFLGEDQMILFADDRWEWISEPMNDLPLNEQCVFYQAYAKHGGKDKGYDNREALNKAIDYAERKINDAFAEITKRFKLDEDN